MSTSDHSYTKNRSQTLCLNSFETSNFRMRNQLESLCKDIWEGNDYVPDRFSSWIKEDNSNPVGLFVDGELVALGNLETALDVAVAWVKGLRVNTSHQHEGHGTKLVEHMIDLAKKRGFKKIRYATSSRNEPSVHLAKNLGFVVANSIGYFRLSNPYPQHPAPSPITVPLVIDSERLHEVLSSTPELVESGTLPSSLGVRRQGTRRSRKT